MTREDYAQLEGQAEIIPTISAAELTDQTDRTLIWGYNCDRESWHVFLRDGELECVVYRRLGDISLHVRAPAMAAQSVIPNKRLYPEACDFEFCDRLQRKGMWLSFTTFSDDREPNQFHGLVPPLPTAEVAR